MLFLTCSFGSVGIAAHPDKEGELVVSGANLNEVLRFALYMGETALSVAARPHRGYEFRGWVFSVTRAAAAKAMARLLLEEKLEARPVRDSDGFASRGSYRIEGFDVGTGDQ